MSTNSIKLLTGNSHPELAKLVADRYDCSENVLYASVDPRTNGHPHDNDRLGIEMTKIMVLQYSNQETSVTIGESVRDEDGTISLDPLLFRVVSTFGLTCEPSSLHLAVHTTQRHQRRAYGTPHHDQCMQDCLRPPHHGRYSQLPL